MDSYIGANDVIFRYLSEVSPRPVNYVQLFHCVKNAAGIFFEEDFQLIELGKEFHSSFTGQYAAEWILRLTGFACSTDHFGNLNEFLFVMFYVRDDVSYKRLLELISRFCETCKHAEIDKALHAETDMEYFLNDAPKPG